MKLEIILKSWLSLWESWREAPERAKNMTIPKDNSQLENETIALCKPDGNVTDYLIVGFLNDTETSRLITGDTPIVVMTPEGLGTLAVNNANENYVIRFSRLCNIPDTINDIKAGNNQQRCWSCKEFGL